jgi:hypothetical protein
MPSTQSAATPTIPEPPGWFVVADEYDWIVCEEPDLYPGQQGLAIYVRTSITNREQRRLAEAHAGIVA